MFGRDLRRLEIYHDPSRTPEERARDLLEYMTLREKVGQVNQHLFGFACYRRSGDEIIPAPRLEREASKFGGVGALYGLLRADPWSRRDERSGIPPRLARRAYNTVQRCVLERSRLGIPVLMTGECPHGHQALGGYLLPVNLCIGASWNPTLLRDAFRVCGAQLREEGVHLALLSVLDVLRDPRWGRSEECYGEDPYLCSCMARAAVSGCREGGTRVVAKHFCAQGEGTGGVNASAASIGPRELREIHLPPARAVCEAGVDGIMAAYNEIDGVPCHANAGLLRGILREEFGFRGIVMADGTAVDRLDALTGDTVKSGALALRSGVDLSLWDDGFFHLEEAVRRGCVTEHMLDEAVRRVLELKFRCGLFENPLLEENTPVGVYSYEENQQSLELARQGIVLLKNEGELLPLAPDGKGTIAVVGPNAENLSAQLGDYSPPVPARRGVTVREGLVRVCGKDRIRFARGCGLFDGSDAELREAVALAERSDVVVFVCGGSSSRFGSVRFDKNGAVSAAADMDCGEGADCAELTLPGRQTVLFHLLRKTGKPIISVLIAGRPYAVPEIAEGSTALLMAFYPGPMGGKAVAQLLFGLAEPGGRLPVSMPRSSGQLPVFYNSRVSYHAMRYRDLPDGPLFCFGDGLSYTRFACRNVRLSADTLRASDLEEGTAAVVLRFRMENTGVRPGWTVPSLYLHGLCSSVVRRRRELRAFGKKYLQPGEMAEFVFRLAKNELAVWNSALCFCVEPGRTELLLEDGGNLLWRGTLFLA